MKSRESRILLFIYPVGEIKRPEESVRSDYADGVFMKQPENVVYEKGFHGETLPTFKSMAVSKQWFNWAFTNWKRPQPPEIVNCSEAGILTENCRFIPFREAMLKYCVKKFNPAWILKKALR